MGRKMKQGLFFSSIWFGLLVVLMFTVPAFAEFLTFGGVQKDDVNDSNYSNWISAVILSPDNKHVYAAGFGRDKVIVFNRDATTGKLTFVESQRNGVGNVEGLAGALAPAVSPDGKHVYVMSYWNAALAVFSRETVSGKLTFVEVKKDNIDGVNGLARPRSMMVSPDGKHIYVAGNTNSAVVVFSRDVMTGKLTYVETKKRGIGGITSLGGATSVALSPDGKHAYATGFDDATLTVFSRDPNMGKLTLIEFFKDGVNGMQGLEGATYVTLSPDGEYVYVAGFRANAIVVFRRDAGTGKLFFVEVQKNGIRDVDGLCGATSIALSPSGKYLYATGDLDNALAVFSRDVKTGKLTFMEIYKNGNGGLEGLWAPRCVTVSADGKHIYVSGKFNAPILLFSAP